MDNNQISGLAVTTVCSIGFFLAWKYQNKDQYRMAILLLMVCGFVLRLFTAADFFLHEWDERYHALVAKNLIKHPLLPTLYDNPLLPYNYQHWASNHIWVHKQPLPLWTMAGSMYLFGVNEIALRLPSILLTTIGIYLIYYIASVLFNKKVGFLAAFLYSINGLIIELAAGRVATDHVDIFFMFFVELSVFFTVVFIKKHQQMYNVLAGISLGAAILSKWLPALIVLPIWLLLVYDARIFSNKQLWKAFFLFIGATTLVFLPWQIYIFTTFPLEANWEASFNLRHLTEVLDKQTGTFYYFFDKIRINYGELIYLPLCWFLYKLWINPKDYKRLTIFIWFIVPFVFFSCAKTKMQAYILFICPALFMMSADFWYELLAYKHEKYKWMVGLILILMIALPVRYAIERIKPFTQTDRNPQWVKNLRKLHNKGINKGILFNYDKSIEAMFYTELTAYPGIPDKAIIVDLMKQGYVVIVRDDGNVSEEVRRLEGIIIESDL